MYIKREKEQRQQMRRPLIDERSRGELKDKFQRELQDEVDLSVFIGPDNKEYCDFTVQLCKELNELDSRIKPTVYRNGDEKAADLGIVRTPTVLIGWDQGHKVKYIGAPVGQEAGVFIEAISLISRHDSGLQEDSRAKLQNMDRDVSIQVYVTPNCPYCPRAVLLAHQIAIESRGWVESECVEASENMDLAIQFNVSSVPQQVINGDMDSISIGVQPEAKFVDDVLRYGSSRYAEIIEAEMAKRALAERLVDDPSWPVILTDRNFDQAVEKYPILVVDCWAEWCAPCRMVAPVVEALARDYQGRIVFAKLDVDHNRGVAGQHQIMSIPTLLIFKEGRLVDTKIGALPRHALEEVLLTYVD
jgi:thioredoxin